MPSQLPYFRCFVGQWSAIVNRLDARENDLHLKLTLLMFQSGEPLPEQTDRLARQCHVRRSIFEATLQQLIDVGAIIRTASGCIWSPIVREEFEFRQEISSTRSDAAAKRWKKSNETKDPPMQKEGKSTAYAMPTDEKREERREENEDAIAPYKRAEAEAVRREFDAWWALYPNKVDKAAGWKAFPVALKKIGPQGLMDGLRQYIETKPTDRQWLNPATWLNGERWGDRPANVSARQARKTASSVLADLVRSQDGGEFMKHMHELPTDTLTIEGDCYRPVIA